MSRTTEKRDAASPNDLGFRDKSSDRPLICTRKKSEPRTYP